LRVQIPPWAHDNNAVEADKNRADLNNIGDLFFW